MSNLSDNEIINLMNKDYDMSYTKIHFCIDGNVENVITINMNEIRNIINRLKAEDEYVTKTVIQLLYDLRTNMTSVTRYVRHKKENKPSHLTTKYFNERHIEYQRLAENAVENILNCINNNPDIRRISNKQFEGIYENIKSEAVKEFAERLKEKLGDCNIVHDSFYAGYDTNDTWECIDNLLKEMGVRV